MNQAEDILSFLSLVRHFKVTATSNQVSAYSGSGAVQVLRESDDVLFLEEDGKARISNESKTTRCRNAQRWRRIEGELGEKLQLEHLRQGMLLPVRLVDLVWDENSGSWKSVTAHLCGSDTYHATVSISGDKLQVLWEVAGPKKNQRICFEYSSKS